MKNGKLIAVFGVLLLSIGVFSTMAISTTDEAAIVWDGKTVDTSWYNSSKSEFIIDSADELAGLAKLVNDGNRFSGKKIVLGVDIDLRSSSWKPIGTKATSGVNPFCGEFDGQGYRISNLFVVNEAYAGLFGLVGENSKIVNIGIESGKISATSDTISYAGGIAGAVNGRATIMNCYSHADVSAKVSSAGSATSYAGGIVGYWDGFYTISEFSNCYNTGKVESVATSSGSYSVSATAGGVIGYIGGSGSYPMNCYNAGSVSVLASSLSYNKNKFCGGVIGDSRNFISKNPKPFYGLYWLDSTASVGNGGILVYSPFVSFNQSGVLKSSVNAGTYAGTSLVSALNGLVSNDNEIRWEISTDLNKGYPTLVFPPVENSAGDGNSSDANMDISLILFIIVVVVLIASVAIYLIKR